MLRMLKLSKIKVNLLMEVFLKLILAVKYLYKMMILPHEELFDRYSRLCSGPLLLQTKPREKRYHPDMLQC